MPDPSTGRARVAIVTTHWGTSTDEVTEATRLFAGALATRAEVEVVHLASPPEPPSSVHDSVFVVHRVPLHGARPLRAGIVRGALASHDGGRAVPKVASDLLERLGGWAPDAPDAIGAISPSSVVLAGHEQPFDPAVLGRRGAPGAPRVVLLPYTSDPAVLRSERVARLVERADVVATSHSGERRALDATFPELAGRFAPVDCGYSVNRSATANRLFGVRFFGAYVLTIRSFPPGGPRWERSLTHDTLRATVGSISVAEVDGDRWRISDEENTLELPVSPSRVNLWRLMAHALATIDLRPAGPLGREAIESMLLGTPVVVPDRSASMEHAADADGGLWYRDLGELVDCVRALTDPGLRARLALQARAWAERTHGDLGEFVDRASRLVLDER